MKRPNLHITLSACLLLATTSAFTQVRDPETVGKLEALLYHVDRMYVDDVDDNELVETAIVSMLEELDPHSVYIPKEELEQVNEPLKGNFEGVGIRFNIMRDTIYVVDAITGGPSEKLGIRAGDRVVKIDDEVVAGTGIKNKDVIERLRGKKGTEVEVAIKRSNEKKLLDFNITRDKIPITSIEAAYMATPEIGYIKVSRFSATTMKEFRQHLEDLGGAGMQSLILDLQGNGGGYLRTAIEMADEFLKEDELLVYTEGRSTPRDNTYATSNGRFEQGKLVVMIDEGSASASEIVTGAVQDHDRGLVIGRRSFGKGLVQRPVMLPDGSAVRLTVSRYYTPSGRCIQKPYEDGVKAYAMEKYDRLRSGELTSIDSITVADSLKFYTGKERVVYGGGGIMPDIFVPVDTAVASDLFGQLVRRGVMNQYALGYVDKHRAALLDTYKDVDSFGNGFSVDDVMLSELLAKGKAEEIEIPEEGLTDSKELTSTRIKSLIARDLWNTSAYYQIMNPRNPIDASYQRAIEVINDNTFQRIGLASN